VVPVWAGRALSALLGASGVLVLAILLGAAFFGPQEAVRNLATVGIWVIWWVGFLLFSALIVCLWPQADPFRRLAALGARAVGRPWTSDASDVPAAAGLLAPAGLLAIAWVELVSDWSEDPFALGVMVCVYLALAVAGGIAFGRAWFYVADPLGRIFSVLGRVAPIAPAGPAALRLRLPGEGLLEHGPIQRSRGERTAAAASGEGQAPSGKGVGQGAGSGGSIGSDRALARSTAPRGEVALVTGLIGIVLFDGLSETPAWAAVLDHVSESQTLRPMLLWLREQGADLTKLVRTVGLLATVATFYALYWSMIATIRTLVDTTLSTGELARAFVGTLLPIAVAYHLSHYSSYLLIAGQLVYPAASDPFGLGWDLFRTHNWSLDIGVIGAEQVWWIAFVALIAGHALSVLVSHRRALQVFGEPRQAALSQVPMTLAMVGLTVLSLWILSQPITE